MSAPKQMILPKTKIHQVANHVHKIGFWRKTEDEDSDLPWPGDFIDEDWDSIMRRAVAHYLGRVTVSSQDAVTVVGHYRGFSLCRLCGKANGSQDYSDGQYYWPQGFSHYVKDHAVRPPRKFVQRVINWRRSRNLGEL